jgi:hypothetical protein
MCASGEGEPDEGSGEQLLHRIVIIFSCGRRDGQGRFDGA